MKDDYFWIILTICGTFFILTLMHIIALEDLEKMHHQIAKVNNV